MSRPGTGHGSEVGAFSSGVGTHGSGVGTHCSDVGTLSSRVGIHGSEVGTRGFEVGSGADHTEAEAKKERLKQARILRDANQLLE